MDPEPLEQLTRILQLSITPVALISGIGLVLLSMTNRLGRVIDRARDLGREPPPHADAELRILFRRARLLQVGIALIGTSVFLAVLMVIALFAMHLAPANLSTWVLGLFGVCLLCLVTAVACFLGEVFLSIRWLRLTLGPLGEPRAEDSTASRRP